MPRVTLDCRDAPVRNPHGLRDRTQSLTRGSVLWCTGAMRHDQALRPEDRITHDIALPAAARPW